MTDFDTCLWLGRVLRLGHLTGLTGLRHTQAQHLPIRKDVTTAGFSNGLPFCGIRNLLGTNYYCFIAGIVSLFLGLKAVS